MSFGGKRVQSSGPSVARGGGTAKGVGGSVFESLVDVLRRHSGSPQLAFALLFTLLALACFLSHLVHARPDNHRRHPLLLRHPLAERHLVVVVPVVPHEPVEEGSNVEEEENDAGLLLEVTGREVAVLKLVIELAGGGVGEVRRVVDGRGDGVRVDPPLVDDVLLVLVNCEDLPGCAVHMCEQRRTQKHTHKQTRGAPLTFASATESSWYPSSNGDLTTVLTGPPSPFVPIVNTSSQSPLPHAVAGVYGQPMTVTS